MNRPALALAATLLAGCNAGGPADAAPDYEPQPQPLAAPLPALQVWAHSLELQIAATAAAERLQAASGLWVQVNEPGTMQTALPVFYTGSLAEHGWLGLATDQWIGIGTDTPPQALESVALHELMHELGAGHLPDGSTTADGVMAPNATHDADQPELTERDLELLCAVADCWHWQAEPAGTY